jgi:hypothetical protein
MRKFVYAFLAVAAIGGAGLVGALSGGTAVYLAARDGRPRR